ncbi:hypothetical protein ACM25O_09365 [Sulfitobacter pontiacus]
MDPSDGPIGNHGASLGAGQRCHDRCNSPDRRSRATAPAEPFQQTIAIACRFTWECVENEPCTETEFTPDITGNAGGASADALTVQSQMVSDAETVDMTGTKQVKALSLTGGGFDARHLLSIAADGASRYTVHYADGPIVISYLGTCK